MSLESSLPLLSVKKKASDNYAQVTKALYADWEKNFKPFLTDVLGSTTLENPAQVGEAVARSQNLVGSQFDAAKNNQRVTMSRLGMVPDAQTEASMERLSALRKTAALAGAANKTRADLKERDTQIMLTGVPNVAGRSYGMSGD